MANKDLTITLKEAVAEVLATLTGLDLEYDPNLDRFQAITRALNRALRAVALEHEWSYYASTEEIGIAETNMTEVEINSSVRPRIINDDAVRLVNDAGITRVWAHFVARDSLHKFIGRQALKASITRSTISFSRPILLAENGLHIMAPVMREPKMFQLPKDGSDVPTRILNQPIDFDYPDLVIARAAMYVADADPVMQPRVQTLEARYKDIMYSLSGRDDEVTEAPEMLDFVIPMAGSLIGRSNPMNHLHPHADERYR